MSILDRWKASRYSQPIRMSEYFDKNRDDYIDLLFHVSTHANWHDWLEFCIQGTLRQAQDTIERCERLRIIREEFMQRVNNVGGSVRLNQIVEDILYSPFVRVVDLPSRLNITYPTAKADIQRLVDAGSFRTYRTSLHEHSTLPMYSTPHTTNWTANSKTEARVAKKERRSR